MPYGSNTSTWSLTAKMKSKKGESPARAPGEFDTTLGANKISHFRMTEDLGGKPSTHDRLSEVLSFQDSVGCPCAVSRSVRETSGRCRGREKIDWREPRKFDCWLERTIFIFLFLANFHKSLARGLDLFPLSRETFVNQLWKIFFRLHRPMQAFLVYFHRKPKEKVR